MVVISGAPSMDLANYQDVTRPPIFVQLALGNQAPAGAFLVLVFRRWWSILVLFLVLMFRRLWSILVLFLVLFWCSCFVDCGRFWCSFWCFSGARVS